MAQDSSTQTFLSFIITYHDEPVEMLRECINSIRNIDLQDSEREIIVVDDGSKHSPINEMEDNKAHFLYIYQRRQGVSAARNKGMAMATGRYIQFVDADDRLLYQEYNKCLNIAKEKDADIILFHPTSDNRRQAKDINHQASSATTGTEYLRHHNLRGSACCYLFKKSILSGLRFTENIDYAEDEEFTANLFINADTLVATKIRAYFYRQHSKSATHNKQLIDRRLDDTYKVICRLNNNLDHLPKEAQLAMQRRIAQLSMDYLYNTLILTRSRKRLQQNINALATEGLFPLPRKHYTMKYSLFRLFSKLLYHSNTNSNNSNNKTTHTP